NGRIHQIGASNGEPVVGPPGGQQFYVGPRTTVQVAYRPDGQVFAVSNAIDGNVRLVYTQGGGFQRVLSSRSPVMATTYSPDGWLAIARSDDTIQLHEP